MSDTDSINDFLRPSEFGAVLGLRERQTRKVLAELEVLGFDLPVAPQGQRLVPPGLAAAVKAARAQGKEVASLRLNPAMSTYLRRDARGVEPDPLDVLIYTAAELGIVRETVAVLGDALNVPSVRAGLRPFSWANLSLPDPRNGL